MPICTYNHHFKKRVDKKEEEGERVESENRRFLKKMTTQWENNKK